jgi:arylsulfatase A-like enzyme
MASRAPLAIFVGTMLALPWVGIATALGTDPPSPQSRPNASSATQTQPSQTDPSQVPPPAARTARSHLFLYLIDGLRAVEIPAYGHPEMTMPALTDMMDAGLTLTSQYATSPWTLSSVASAFTSLYPAAHGLQKAGERLPSAATTLAEILKRAGYDTALFTTHPLVGPLSGLDQGFDHVEEIQGPYFPSVHRAAEETSTTLNRRILEWLGKRTSASPVFVTALSSDLLEPYGVPGPAGSRFIDAAELTWYRATRKKLLALRPGPLSPATGEDLKKLKVDASRFALAARGVYDGAIFYNDSQIRSLRNALSERGLLQESIFAATSTRGEEFLEHGFFGHGASLYDPAVLIPLVITRPGPPAPYQIGKMSDNVDLMPTLLALLQVPIPEGVQGADRTMEPRREYRRFVERPAFADARPAGELPTGEMSMIAEEGSKFIAYEVFPFGIQGPEVQLFRRGQVPGDWEVKNFAGGRPDLMAARRESLAEWKQQCGRFKLAADSPEPKPDPRLKEILRALGYLQGTQP